MSDLKAAQQVLDAYSAAVSAVIDTVRPAVVRVQAAGRGGPHWSPGRARTNYGSGVIVDAAAGHVATNFHVVRGSPRAQVHLHDGTAVMGEVLGADPEVDLAVVRIPAENLTAAAWGDSGALRVGSAVIALGNPDGDGIVATRGIVSALGQAIRGPAGRLLEGLIQTDALFNPGMSGGPLVNSAGQIVGINTASLIEAQGINLAISSAVAQRLLPDLIAYGEVRRPRLGIAGERQRIYPGLLRHHQLRQTHGVFLHEVRAGSPAAQAGLQAGDILVAADGQIVEGLDDLHRILAGKQVGATMTIRLLRDLDLLEVTVRLTPLESEGA